MSDKSALSPSPRAASNSIALPPSHEGSVLTGAVLPTDMRIRLIRADSSAFDTILTVLFSITLTLFGVFLGAWISDPVTIAFLGKVATVAFGVISLALMAWWVVIKVCQMKKGVTVPLALIEGQVHQ